MIVPDESLDEFIAIYKEEYGEELSRSEASEMAFRLVTLYGLLMKKLPNDQPTEAKPPAEDAPSIGFLR